MTNKLINRWPLLLAFAMGVSSQVLADGNMPYAASAPAPAGTDLRQVGTPLAPLVVDANANVVSIAKSRADGSPDNNDIQNVPKSVVSNLGQPADPVQTNQTIVIKPGVNTLIPVSIGQTNRIVTPFERPVVQTLSSAETKIFQNVIYISPGDKNPVAVYITEKDDESAAISLTLLPQKIPPIQANLVISAPINAGLSGIHSVDGTTAFTAKAKQFEQAQPYMETIKVIMRSLALGEVPQGYSIGKLLSGSAIPSCHLSGFEFDFKNAQLIKGHDYNAIVATVRNISGQTLQFDEMACTHPLLAATAVWPKNVLEPGERTELYVATRSANNIVRASKRPSLLDN